jgi:hypothetical protein
MWRPRSNQETTFCATGLVDVFETLCVEAKEEDKLAYSKSFLEFVRVLHAAPDYSERFLEYLSTHNAVLYHHLQDNSTEYGVGQQSDGWKHFAEFASLGCYNRRIFGTDTGSFGLGPGCLRVGHIAVEFVQAKTSYPLRPYGERYLLLGQVYVDDLTNEGMIREMEAGKCELQKFCLD